jgi:chromosome segregation ATPase
MDTQQTAATERAAALRNQLAGLASQKQKTETKLAEEHATIRRAAVKRGELVESLIGASEAIGRATHREIDQLDSVIRVSERMAESLQKALAKAVQESESLSRELNEVERVIQAEERAKGLDAFRIKLHQATRRVSESLDNARADLKALAVLETNAVDAYGINAHLIAEPIFAEFFQRQGNLAGQGWSLFYTARNLQFLIRPMTRG